MSTDLNLLDPKTFDHGVPYEEFARLRRESPVFRHDHPTWAGGFWNVMSHDLVQRVSRDATSFSNQPNPFLSEGSEDDMGSSGLLISLDPPDHTKHRKLINKGFTPRRVAELGEKIDGIVDGIIERVADKGACDMVSDIAVELPLDVIAEMVGVPPEDRHQIFEWTEQTFSFDPDQEEGVAGQAAAKLYGYADAMCSERLDNPTDDLISVLLHAEVDGERLDQLTIDLFFMLLQNAGSETTRNLLTTGTLLLLQHPDQLAKLRAEPELMAGAVEELLRYVTPVMQFVRRANHDIVIGGETIKAGEAVTLWYTSANRDAAVFDEPDGLDIERDASAHVAFGAGGPHFCLGASLARMEARRMFTAMIHRFEDLEVTADPATLPRVRSNLIDGFAELPISWSAVR